MDVDLQKTRSVVLRDTRHPRWCSWLERADFIWLCVGIAAVLLGHRVRTSAVYREPWEFASIGFAAMVWLSGSFAVRYRWSLAKPTFLRTHRLSAIVTGLWVTGLIAVIILGPVLPEWTSRSVDRLGGIVIVSEIALLLHGMAALLASLRGAAAGPYNPALLLVLSFVLLVFLGTVLLMLPRARAHSPTQPLEAAEGAPFVTALFTATSAACVTGLIVEDTPTYWSREGQIVILGLFQIGGLGIMTFGAFFGLLAGRGVGLREHATLSDLLESEGLGDARRLVLAILGFTLGMELLGTIGLWGLWSGQTAGEQLFQSVFHAVSGFCNAGFSLTENSFVGQAHRWQVWGVLSVLIIVGGLGFAVLNDLSRLAMHKLRPRRNSSSLIPKRAVMRLSLSSRLVLVTTGVLLVSGAAGILLLERATMSEAASSLSWADAWFQSVTVRTAGFNTVEVGELHQTTKLIAILLMFIGASSGSTGGGIKTVTFSLAVLGLISVLRGRRHIECFGRTLPDELVLRALAVMFLSLLLIMVTTILLTLYEDTPAHFLDYLFEATSAVGTVGLSSTIATDGGDVLSVTQSLSTPSRLVMVAAMFLGRVGPLTLLLAIGGRTSVARYHYPEERVMLG